MFPKAMLSYNAKNLYPVQSSPDPIRCPVAPGVHGMKKEARFPWRGLGYFSILLLIVLHLSPLFPKSATLSQLSFPGGCSGPFLPLEDALGELRGFMWHGASTVLGGVAPLLLCPSGCSCLQDEAWLPDFTAKV